MTIARRLQSLETLWSRGDGTITASPRETQLTTQLVFAIEQPAACAPPEVAAHLRYLHETIHGSGLPSAAVARSLAAALVACGYPEDEARDAVREAGVDGMLEALAERAAPVAQWQRDEREHDAVEWVWQEQAREAAARATYFKENPRASERDFTVGYWPRMRSQRDERMRTRAGGAVSPAIESTR